MARCSCDSGTCSCVLRAGDDSVTITGSGSPNSPYEITATGDLSNAFQVLDTQTVDLLLAGSGHPGDPFQLSAVATVGMDDLTDVADPTPPDVGDVPMWMGDHWEFQPATSGTPGAIVANQGLQGNGSAISPLQAIISGYWGQDTMGPVPPWPSDSTLGLPVYLDSNGALRAQPLPFLYASNTDVPTPPPVFTPANGWALDGGYLFVRWAAICCVSFNVKRTGAPIANSAAHGDIANQLIGKIADAYPAPASGGASIAVPSASGPLHNIIVGSTPPAGQTPPWGAAYSTRNLVLTATTGGWTIPQNQLFTVKIWYLSIAGMTAYTPQLDHGAISINGAVGTTEVVVTPADSGV